MCCNEEANIGVPGAVGIVQICLDRKASSMKCRACLIYAVHPFLPDFHVEPKQKTIYNRNTLVRIQTG